MELKKVTEGLENFITTDDISTVLAGDKKLDPPIIQPCYGIELPPVVEK